MPPDTKKTIARLYTLVAKLPLEAYLSSENFNSFCREYDLTDTWKERTIAVDNEEVVPGISVMWLGGHTPCSQGVCVQTALGEAILTGDTVSLLHNIDKQIPVGVHHNLGECRTAMKKLAERNAIVIPSHDPGIFERFPKGVIG